MNSSTTEQRQNHFSKELLSSVHINFLFGAGINGKAFPQLDGFIKTNNKMIEFGYPDEIGFEDRVDLLDEEQREVIKKAFIEEFKEYESGIDYDNPSIKNIELMLSKAAQIVSATQNRTRSMKQINIYTLNYDCIIEYVLQSVGLFYNSISASNIRNSAQLMNVIGYDYSIRNYVPSFLISKLHGDISAPIIPGRQKYKELLDEDYFEIAFNMKEHLCKPNSILVVIGYSGNDKHINKILMDCIGAGLRIYWYKYKEEDNPIEVDKHQIFIQEQPDYDNLQDTTKNCYEDLCEIWEEKLEEL